MKTPTNSCILLGMLTDAELLDYSREHLLYEVQMLFITGLSLLGRPQQLSEPIKNAVIESFAMHTRNLIDFLYPSQVRDTDVVAGHFCSPASLSPCFDNCPDNLKEARRRANKEVGHLTTDRISGAPPEKSWPVAELLTHIGNEMLYFATKRASPAKLDRAKLIDFIEGGDKPEEVVVTPSGIYVPGD